MTPAVLELLNGAQVASCANLADGDKAVPNGTMGSVVRFESIDAGGHLTLAPVVCSGTVSVPVTACVQARVCQDIYSISGATVIGDKSPSLDAVLTALVRILIC